MDLFSSPKFASRVKYLLDEHHVPGLAVALVQNEIIVSAGYGNASLDPPKDCTPDTLFDIASASKSLTAASVGLLVADEKQPDLKYESIVSHLLPGDFVMPGTGYTEGVTVEDILGHRTGMPRHDASYLGPRAVHTDDARSVTRNLRNLAIAAPLRTKYMYNNMMYTVASYLVEKRSGLSFAEFLESHFFEPLGMASSNLQFERARAKGLGDRIATSYHWDKESESYKGFQSPDAPEAQGAGSVVTSANDYIKWVKAIMNHEAPITEEIYKGLIRARSLPNPDYAQLNPYTSPKVYAAGWEVSYYRGHMMVYHAGAIPGVGTRHWFLPAHKFGGVIFGNGDKAYIVAAILMQELIDALLEISEDQKPDWDKVFKDYSAAMEGDEDNVAELREQLSPGLKEDEPQKMPLEAYTGEYWNPGYHGMKVEIREGKLFIDATDRSFGSTITFDHVCEQTKYIAHVSDFFEGGDMPFRAEFKFDNDRTTKMGLHLEDALEEYIWFDRVNDKGDEEKSA